MKLMLFWEHINCYDDKWYNTFLSKLHEGHIIKHSKEKHYKVSLKPDIRGADMVDSKARNWVILPPMRYTGLPWRGIGQIIFIGFGPRNRGQPWICGFNSIVTVVGIWCGRFNPFHHEEIVDLTPRKRVHQVNQPGWLTVKATRGNLNWICVLLSRIRIGLKAYYDRRYATNRNATSTDETPTGEKNVTDIRRGRR